MICLRIACRNVAQAHVLSRTLDEMEYDGMPPNGLAFSCRERAAQNGVKKPTILRAKRSTERRVGWQPAYGASQCDIFCISCYVNWMRTCRACRSPARESV